MISLDMLTLVGSTLVVAVLAVLFFICKTKGCNKPLC
jgi:hypothetical protein